MNLNEIGEFGLIEKLRARLKNRGGVRLGIGDDAALLESLRAPLVTTDCLVEGVHFRRDWTSARSLGIKSIAVNVSDIAAMGGKPIAAFVSLALGARDDLAFVEELYDGLESACELYDLTLCGGDFSRSPNALFLNVTVVGEASTRDPILRSGAKVGDALLVTGTLGDSAAGLALLRHEEKSTRANNEKLASTRAENVPLPAREKQSRAENNRVKNMAPDSAFPARENRLRVESNAIPSSDAPAVPASDCAENAPLNNELSPRQNDASSASTRRENAPRNSALSERENWKRAADQGGENETTSASTRDAAPLSAGARDFLLQRHFEPTARLREIEAALKIAPTAIHAALDLSDGLAGDAAHIARASQVSLRIETARLSLSEACCEAARVLARDATSWALYGGEDYELLLCIAPQNAEEVARAIAQETGTRATLIGYCVADENPCVTLLDENGNEVEARGAFTHF